MKNIEQLRRLLDRFIDTSNLTDLQVLQIIESESVKNNTYLHIGG